MASRFSSGGDLGLGPPGRVDYHAESSRPDRKSKAPGFSRPSLTAGGMKSGTSKRVSASQSSARASGSARFSGVGSHRASTAGRARLSSMGARGSCLVKDPRNLRDPNFQRECRNQLVSYLAENGCPREFERKDFQSPSTTTFLFVLNFILEKLHPSLVLDGMRLPEELPLLLKNLGYPSIVSKNHLLSVGSPHSWPILLGMLSWLIEGDQGDITDQILFPADSDFTAPSELAKESEIDSLLYKAFMERSEEYDHLYQQRTDMYKHKYENSVQSLEDLEATNSQLQQQLDDCQSSTATLQTKLEENQQDQEQLLTYISLELEPLLQKTRDSCRELDAVISRTELQIEAAKDRDRELEGDIKKQSMSSEEARPLRERVANKEDSLSKLRQTMSECQDRISELQMQYNTSVSKLDQVGKMVNSKLRRLVGSLPDAACLGSLNYDTSKRADQEFLKNLRSQAKSIQNGIQQLHGRVAGEISEAEGHLIEVESAVNVLKNDLVKKNLEVESVDHEVKIERTHLDQLRKKHEDEMKSFMSEKRTLEKKLLSIQEELESDNDVAKELESVKKEVASELSKMAAGATEKTQELQEFCVELAKYLEACKVKTKRMGKKVDLLVEEFHKIKMPAVKAKYMPPPKEDSS